MPPVQWHIGCSGFHYREWKEVFYPKGLAQSRWLEFYAQHFNTLELNVTFYRFPSLASLEGWEAKAPEGFRFASKVPRQVTHFQKFTGTETLLRDFYGVLREGLKQKLGPVLFQLPPSFSYAPERLETILAQVDDDYTNVIEFRHESWWRADVQQALARRNISFCGVSFPRIRFDAAVVNTPLAYYRFHGVPVLFHSAYDESFLESVHRQLLAHHNLREAYVYFNNTASAAALANAQYFQRLTETV